MAKFSRKLSLFVTLIGGIGLSVSSAQVQSMNSSIQGEVTDSACAVIPGAAVEVDAVETAVFIKP